MNLVKQINFIKNGLLRFTLCIYDNAFNDDKINKIKKLNKVNKFSFKGI